MSCETSDGIDLSGVRYPLRYRIGNSIALAADCTLSGVLTISSADFVIFDSDGASLIVGDATVSGDTIEFGDAAADLADLEVDGDYTYELRATLSNGKVQTIMYGPLTVIGRGEGHG